MFKNTGYLKTTVICAKLKRYYIHLLLLRYYVVTCMSNMCIYVN